MSNFSFNNDIEILVGLDTSILSSSLTISIFFLKV